MIATAPARLSAPPPLAPPRLLEVSAGEDTCGGNWEITELRESETCDAIRKAFADGLRVDKATGAIFGPTGKSVRPITAPALQYPRLFIYPRGTRKRRWFVDVHRVIGYALWGEAAFQPGLVIRHLNDNRQDWSPENLALGTHADNVHDIPIEKRRETAQSGNSRRWLNPRFAQGSRPLTHNEVRDIRAAAVGPGGHGSGRMALYQHLAAEYAVSWDVIRNVIRRMSYSYVPDYEVGQ